jgi:hypothetical protein
VVDAHSTWVHEIHATTISMYISNLKYIIMEATNSDRHYLQIEETLQQGNFQ